MKESFFGLLLLCLTVAGCHSPQQGRWRKGILTDEFIFTKAPFKSCHASTIAETPQGLVAAWFGGTREGAHDVCIWVSRKQKGGSWTAPENVANGILSDSVRWACWNPVLYQIPGGDLLLFYKIGHKPSSWKGWMKRSADGGKTWSQAMPLPDGILGPIKDKPVLVGDSTLLCGSSTEDHGWHIHFETTSDWGRTWQKTPDIADSGKYKAIQPTILFHGGDTLQALCRSQERAILQTWSYDGGKTWTPLSRTSLPNNNSGIDAVTLKDGRQLLVYNHVLPPPGKAKGARTPLNVAISPDGKTWYAAAVLETSHISQYSYPGVIQTADGLVHIVYTWRRQRIKHVVLDPAKLELTKIENGKWPSE